MLWNYSKVHVQLLLPCENTLWQCRAERGQTATVGHQAAGMEDMLLPCENILWQCRAERGQTATDCNSWPPGSRNGEGSLRAEIIMNRLPIPPGYFCSDQDDHSAIHFYCADSASLLSCSCWSSADLALLLLCSPQVWSCLDLISS